MHQLINLLLETISGWGYYGLFVLMAIESSVIPLPSELVVIPAGYLAAKGEMQIIPILVSSTLGSIFGALINYYFAMLIGRRFINKYGRFFFIPPDKLKIVESFFHKHGSFSTFSGRLIPVIRHLISIPAGLARMNMKKFIFYTGTGAGIWVMILIALGYFIGQNEMLLSEYLRLVTFAVILCLLVFTAIYIKLMKRSKTTADKYTIHDSRH